MKKLISTLKYSIPTVLLVLFVSFLIVSTTQAATLAAVYVFLSRIKVNLDGTSGNTVEMILAIDTATSISSGGTITIEFADAEDAAWCRTAGSLTVSAVSASVADLPAGNWDIDSGLPNSGTSLAAVCSQGGDGSSDTITISNVGALTAGTTYGVQVSNGSSSGILGTHSSAGEHVLTISARSGGIPIDSKTFKISLVANDVVTITATVSELPSITCYIGSNSVNLGTLYPGGAYVTGSHNITTTAGSPSQGYYWAVYGTGDSATDAGLWNGTTLIESSGSGARLDFTNPTVNGFGMTFTAPTGTTVPTNFQTTPAGGFGTIDRLYSGAQLVLQRSTPTTVTDASTVTYGAKAQPTATSSSSYSEYVYFVCGAYY